MAENWGNDRADRSLTLCDQCFNPGACCRYIQLQDGNGEISFWDDESIEWQIKKLGLPFLPLEPSSLRSVDEDTGRTYRTWYLQCPNLLENGRCGDYENRPQLCRTFEPAGDALCVHYRGAEGGDPTLGMKFGIL